VHLKAEKDAQIAQLKSEKDAQIAQLKSEKDAQIAQLKAESAQFKNFICSQFPLANICSNGN
jgi:regulator of protease activity HflC (stomatin/prohibitin superfamily)